MPLHIVATHIGNIGDVSARAIESLRSADLVIGEERKEASKLLKFLQIGEKPIKLLNEHSSEADLVELLNDCKSLKVALVTDAGTPGFCDPGAKLVAACRREGLQVVPVPGASSLMTLLSVCGHRLDQFLFRGFLPADRELRQVALSELTREKRAVVLMDTPYRLGKLLEELKLLLGDRSVVLGLSLTQEAETVVEDRLSVLQEKFANLKAEFILIILPSTNSATAHPRPEHRPQGQTPNRQGAGQRNPKFRKFRK